MGCNQSRKETSFSAEELKKLRDFHQKTANSYPETKGKDDLNVQAFRDIFSENVHFGERLHSFILKLSTTQRVDVEIFIDVLELLMRKPLNKKLQETFASQDKVGIFCMILFPHMRKTLQSDQKNKQYLINYSEAFDFILCILRMFNAQPDQRVNEANAKVITDKIFANNDSKIEYWSFAMLIKEQISLIGSLIHIYLKGKFLDGTVSFLLPSMPDLSKQKLIAKDQLTFLYLNNQYLLNACELKLLYQGTTNNYDFQTLVNNTQAFTGQTFVLLQFQDSQGQKFTVGGFNPAKWTSSTAINNNAPQNQYESVECYVFSLLPKYKHFYPVMDQYGQRPVYKQQFVLNTEGGYNREVGLAFGASKNDSRIWLDGKQLQESTVSNNEKFFKKGALIPQNAVNPTCTLVEVYGVKTDLTKKNYSYSAANVNQLSYILPQNSNIRQSIGGYNYESSSYAFRSTQRTEEFNDEVVKRSKQRPSNNQPSQSNISYSLPSYQPVTTTAYSSQIGGQSTPNQYSINAQSPVILSTSQGYLQNTSQPVTTTTTYSYENLGNSTDAQQRQAIEALTKKYESIALQNSQSAAPRSTVPVEYTYTYTVQPQDSSLGRSSSIPTYQTYNQVN